MYAPPILAGAKARVKFPHALNIHSAASSLAAAATQKARRRRFPLDNVLRQASVSQMTCKQPLCN
jgi:hypothetical protein